MIEMLMIATGLAIVWATVSAWRATRRIETILAHGARIRRAMDE